MRDATLDCPVELFENFADLLKLGTAAGLACYGSSELSFLATVLSCGCGVGGSGNPAPDWLTGIGHTQYRLAAPWLEPAQVGPPFPHDLAWIRPAFHPDWFENATGDLPLTVGEVYQVWGHYDDPAAATCIWTDPEPGLDQVALIASCRMTLVVTQVEPFAGIDPG